MRRRRVEFAFKKGDPVTERETEVGSTFRFISVCTLFFKQTVAKDKQKFFTMFHFVQSFVARCCKDAVCVRSAEQSERSLILSRL